jgi:Domain of unknown function (DUF4388)
LFTPDYFSSRKQEVENVERTQFVVLTGHLDDQPLPDLIRRLRVQRKSGRLQVEYPDGPGAFFFEEGQLVDAQLGALRGLEALYSALALPGASFNFNPLVRPPERNIDRQGQQFIRDLIEGPRREGLAEIKVAGGQLDTPATAHPPHIAPRQLPPAAELMAPLEERLTAVEEAIVSTSRRFSRERMVYAVIIGFLAGLGLVATLNLIFDPFRPAAAPSERAASNVTAGSRTAQTSPEAAAGKGQEGGPAGRERGAAPAVTDSAQKAKPATEPAQPPVPASAAVIGTRRSDGVTVPRGVYVVQVLVEVKDGRVIDARVWNPRPGAGAYEAVALKMARERRYPESFTGGERLRIRVQP